MIKGVGVMFAGFLGAEVAQVLGIICTLGGYCYTVTPGLLDQVKHFFDVLAQAVFYTMTLIGIVAASYGAIRKGYLTVTGRNRVLEE
jgi:hypothetical protein